ncbi:hypothetical protein BH20ACT21_BH20ACT21_03850 [soil metagenome]
MNFVPPARTHARLHLERSGPFVDMNAVAVCLFE